MKCTVLMGASTVLCCMANRMKGTLKGINLRVLCTPATIRTFIEFCKKGFCPCEKKGVAEVRSEPIRRGKRGRGHGRGAGREQENGGSEAQCGAPPSAPALPGRHFLEYLTGPERHTLTPCDCVTHVDTYCRVCR